MAERLRRSENDDHAARPPHPSLRHRRDRQRKLALQKPRLSCPAPTGFRDVTIGSGPMPRKPIGEKAMTDAERQARYRVALAADAPVIRTRRPADHRSRARRWQDAVAQLCELQAQYADWLEALPANQHDSLALGVGHGFLADRRGLPASDFDIRCVRS